ncbi:DNA-binding transcriptional regulator [Rhodothermaceae bacterium RA]|nr:DNA-binding transcriptional regulator [Rhodothermaceae bacterium RA]
MPLSSESSLATLRHPQLWRLRHLIAWLQDGRRFTRRTAAAEFQVSVRTISDDIERLKSLGVPVDWDARRNTYHLTEPFDDLPFLSIKRTEYAAFLVARFALEALGDTPDALLLKGLVERLSGHLPPEVQVHPDTLSRAIQIHPGSRPRYPARFLDLLRTAAERQQVVTIRYRANTTGEETTRSVEPYRVFHRDGFWYLIGYCRRRQDVRSFRIDRIRGLTVTDEIFLPEADFDLDAYLDETFGMHWDGRCHPVHIRFSAYEARWIREQEWHPTQILIERPDGSLDLHMEVTGLTDVTRWVLSYGGEAEVISPPVLRHRVAREARRMAALYAGVGAVDASGHP